MNQPPENPTPQPGDPENPTPQPGDPDSAAPPERGGDDRRIAVNPADDPAPRSPELDQEATRQGEEILERIKPY